MVRKESNVIKIYSLFLFIIITFNVLLFSNSIKYNSTTETLYENTVDLYDLKISGQQINITTPENKTYTGPMDGYYPATWGFENDESGSDPDGWTVNEGGGPLQIIESLGDHNKVVEIYDNTGSDESFLYSSFSEQLYGTVECWARSSDLNQAAMFSLKNSSAINYDGPSCFTFALDSDRIRYVDSTGWHTTNKVVLANVWYQIRIDFECTSGGYLGLSQWTWRAYVNGEIIGEFSFQENVIPGKTFYYTYWQDSGYHIYIDAIGYSWDQNYNIGDNYYEGLLLSFEENITPDWIGYSLDAQSNNTILGNTTISFLDEGIHAIQMFGNDSLGTIFHSEIRYFTTLYYPEVSITTPNHHEFFGNTAPSFVISINETNLHSSWYNLNDGVNITFSGLSGSINQIEWDKLVNGSVTMKFYANDTWGLEGYDEVTIWKDTYSPTSSIFFFPHSGIDVVNETTEFSLTADDGLGSGVSFIRYRINDSSWMTYTAPFTLANYPYGDIIISYQAVDQVDNYETIQTLLVHRTDTIAPTSSILFTPYEDPNIVIRSTTFTISADDGLGSGISLIRYKIDDSTWFDYLGPFSLSGYQDGDHTITFQAVDVVGNIEVEHGIMITLVSEPTPPGIPGYHLFVILGIISIVSAIIIKKRFESKF